MAETTDHAEARNEGPEIRGHAEYPGRQLYPGDFDGAGVPAARMSNALKHDLERAVKGVFRENGITEWSVDLTGKHRKYRFTWNDEEMIYVTAASPSDWRSPAKAATALRHLLGVRRIVHKNPENRKKPHRKTVRAGVPKVPCITVGKDPWEKLKEVRIVASCSAAEAPSPSFRQRALLWIQTRFQWPISRSPSPRP